MIVYKINGLCSIYIITQFAQIYRSYFAIHFCVFEMKNDTNLLRIICFWANVANCVYFLLQTKMINENKHALAKYYQRLSIGLRELTSIRGIINVCVCLPKTCAKYKQPTKRYVIKILHFGFVFYKFQP